MQWIVIVVFDDELRNGELGLPVWISQL